MSTTEHAITASAEMRDTAQRYLDLMAKYERASDDLAALPATHGDAIRDAERSILEYRAQMLYVGQRLAEQVLRHA